MLCCQGCVFEGSGSESNSGHSKDTLSYVHKNNEQGSLKDEPLMKEAL